jgi:hypothetical protein
MNVVISGHEETLIMDDPGIVDVYRVNCPECLARAGFYCRNEGDGAYDGGKIHAGRLIETYMLYKGIWAG